MFQYAYKYEDEYGVYLVRSLDGSLLYSIPDGLFQTIKNEEIKRTKKSKVQQISQEHGMNK